MEIKRTHEEIKNGYRVMIIMRGLPGSGKSSLALNFVQANFVENPFMFIFSTDDYFKRNNTYNYNINELSEAHAWNQKRVTDSCAEGLSPIIVDNTNLEIWEMLHYIKNGIKHGYIIEIIEMNTIWALNPDILARKNKHRVPKGKIIQMKEKFQRNVSVEFLFLKFNLKYSPEMRPPCMRLKPNFVVDSRKYSHPPKQIQQGLQPTKKKNSEHIKTPQHITAVGQNLSPNSPPFIYSNFNQNSFLNGSKPKPVDLIDFTDSSQSNGNIQSTSKNGTDTYNKTSTISKYNDSMKNVDIHQSDNSWEDSWTTVDVPIDNNPKPPRNTIPKRDSEINNYFKNCDSVNWVPINGSISDKDVHKTIDELPTDPTFQNELTDEQKNTSEVSTWTKSDNCDDPLNGPDKIVHTESRNINLHYLPIFTRVPFSKSTFDKGVMARDSDFPKLNEEKEQLLRDFADIFKDVPHDTKQDLLNRCNGDVNWASDVLLDSKTESGFINMFNNSESNSENNELTYIEDFSMIEMETPTLNRDKQTIVEDVKVHKHIKKDKTQSDSSMALRKEIENSFRFHDALYSEHALKLKKRIHGEENTAAETGESVKNDVSSVVVEDEDYHEKSVSENSDDAEDEKTVEFQYGKEFIEQIDSIYGTCYASYESLDRVINMPLSLMNKLHALLLESICNQQEHQNSIIAEDEEFARQLEKLENQQRIDGYKQDTLNYQEILDMEIALASSDANFSQWTNENHEDLASKLTNQKLFDMFPEIDEDTLIEIHTAHDRNFEQTFQVLLISTGKLTNYQTEQADDAALKQILQKEEQILLAKAKERKSTILNTPVEPEPTEEYYNETNCEAAIEKFRNDAQAHLNVRNKYHNKAKEYFDKGMIQTAQYYSSIAALHTNKYNLANNSAVALIMKRSSLKSSSTLDLHHLYVAEAIQVLDVFLDKTILRLQEASTRNHPKVDTVYLITGRGRHSPGNRPRIKPAVMRRLRERNLTCQETNAGLLSVNLSSLDKPSVNFINNY